VFSQIFQATTPGSIQFAGNGFVKHVITAPGADAFTMELWESSSALSTGTPRIFNTGYGFNAQNIVVRYNEAGSTCLVANVANEYLDNGSGSTCSASATPGSWHHIALVSSGGSTPTVGLYVNGVRVLSKTFSSPLNLTGANMVLGATENGGGQEHFTGSMSNFRYAKSAIYSGASFTAPTSPLTNTSTTELLLSTLYDAPPTTAATALAVAIRDYSRNSVTGSTGGTAPLASARHPFPAPTIANASITGNVQPGQTITAQPGAMTGFGNNITYQWQSSATASGTYTNIGSATGSTLVLAAGDVGKFIKVIITLTNIRGSASRTSDATAAVSGSVSINSLSVTQGRKRGGTTSRINGSGLLGTTSITVGGNQATGIRVISDTAVDFFTPASTTLGAKDVVVSKSGSSATRSNGFTYIGVTSGAALDLDAADPASYSGSGTWNDLTTGGNNFTLANSASFDSAKKVMKFSNPNNPRSDATGQHAVLTSGGILGTTSWERATITFTADLGTTANNDGVIFGMSSTSLNGTNVRNALYLTRDGSTKLLRLFINNGSGMDSMYCILSSGDNQGILDGFNHYAVTIVDDYPFRGCRFYVNGELRGTSDASWGGFLSPTSSSRSSALLGRSHISSVNHNNFQLRNLTIYRSTLTTTQITTNYN
jgi:hypothetical protein